MSEQRNEYLFFPIQRIIYYFMHNLRWQMAVSCGKFNPLSPLFLHININSNFHRLTFLTFFLGIKNTFLLSKVIIKKEEVKFMVLPELNK